MMTQWKYTYDWLVIAVIAFVGGLVANIVVPQRRGVWGFFGAATIGTFCGGVAGIMAISVEAHPVWQCFVASVAGVLGDRVLSGILQFKLSGNTTNNFNSTNQQNQFGDDNKQQ